MSSALWWPEFLERYGDLLKCDEARSSLCGSPPTWLSGAASGKYRDLVICWEGVKQKGSKAYVTMCNVCTADRGVGKVPRFSAVNGTLVGAVPPCLQDLTLVQPVVHKIV